MNGGQYSKVVLMVRNCTKRLDSVLSSGNEEPY